MTPTNLAVQSVEFKSAQPNIVTTDAPKEWHLQPRGNSGIFIASTRGTLLCRYDGVSGQIHFWDKKGSCEVSIALSDLIDLRDILNIVV